MESRSATRDVHGCSLHLNGQLRPPWSSYGAYGFSLPGGGGISWPPQRSSSSSSSYTCGYCKREFRSAQALGGHMNVHRRERARLRDYYCSPNSPTTTHRPAPSLPNLNFSPPRFAASTTTTTADDGPAIYSFFSTAGSATTTKAAGAFDLEVNLELGVGGFSSDGGLDLELRLGC